MDGADQFCTYLGFATSPCFSGASLTPNSFQRDCPLLQKVQGLTEMVLRFGGLNLLYRNKAKSFTAFLDEWLLLYDTIVANHLFLFSILLHNG